LAIFTKGCPKDKKDLIFIKELLESGKVMPVIDECYPLRKTAEAFRYFEKVHARGKVVLTVEENYEP
jgi:NADPH:quinone reductase-like Zn-dependent oxidoreductase